MSLKEKIANSKVVRSVATSKTFNNALTAVGSAATAVTALMVSASAETGLGTVITAEVNSADIINNAQPFITAALPILCVVGGIKLGVRFLRSSIH